MAQQAIFKYNQRRNRDGECPRGHGLFDHSDASDTERRKMEEVGTRLPDMALARLDPVRGVSPRPLRDTDAAYGVGSFLYLPDEGIVVRQALNTYFSGGLPEAAAALDRVGHRSIHHVVFLDGRVRASDYIGCGGFVDRVDYDHRFHEIVPDTPLRGFVDPAHVPLSELVGRNPGVLRAAVRVLQSLAAPEGRVYVIHRPGQTDTVETVVKMAACILPRGLADRVAFATCCCDADAAGDLPSPCIVGVPSSDGRAPFDVRGDVVVLGTDGLGLHEGFQKMFESVRDDPSGWEAFVGGHPVGGFEAVADLADLYRATLPVDLAGGRVVERVLDRLALARRHFGDGLSVFLGPVSDAAVGIVMNMGAGTFDASKGVVTELYAAAEGKDRDAARLARGLLRTVLFTPSGCNARLVLDPAVSGHALFGDLVRELVRDPDALRRFIEGCDGDRLRGICETVLSMTAPLMPDTVVARYLDVPTADRLGFVFGLCGDVPAEKVSRSVCRYCMSVCGERYVGAVVSGMVRTLGKGSVGPFMEVLYNDHWTTCEDRAREAAAAAAVSFVEGHGDVSSFASAFAELAGLLPRGSASMRSVVVRTVTERYGKELADRARAGTSADDPSSVRSMAEALRIDADAVPAAHGSLADALDGLAERTERSRANTARISEAEASRLRFTAEALSSRPYHEVRRLLEGTGRAHLLVQGDGSIERSLEVILRDVVGKASGDERARFARRLLDLMG